MSQNTKSAPRCVICLRVSSESQEDNTSRETQLQAGIACVSRLGGSLVAVVDEIVSGSLYAARHGLHQGLDLIRTKQADTLVYYDFSRYSRDREYQEKIRKEVVKMGGTIQFSTLDIPANADGALIFGMHGAVAHYYRLKFAELVKQGKDATVRRGKAVARTWPPFGYHIVTKNDIIAGRYAAELEGKHIVIEDEARWVRDIFARFAAGDSLRGLARWLLENGVKGKHGGAQWYASTLQRLMKNPVYKGKAAHGKTRSSLDEERLTQGYTSMRATQAQESDAWIYYDAPSLVSEAIWNECQKRLTENRERKSGDPARRALLTGLVRCPKCGRNLLHKTKQGKTSVHRSYVCPDASPNFGEPCVTFRYNAPILEAAVLAEVRSYVASPEKIAEWLTQNRQAAAADYTPQALTGVRRKIEGLKKQEDGAVRAQMRGLEIGIDTSAYERILSEIGATRREAELELKRLESLAESARHLKAAATDAQVIATALSDVELALTSPLAETADKNQMLQRIVERIVPAPETVTTRSNKPARVTISFRDV